MYQKEGPSSRRTSECYQRGRKGEETAAESAEVPHIA